VVRSVQTESQLFKASFLATLRKNLEANEEYTSKEKSITVYQKVYE